MGINNYNYKKPIGAGQPTRVGDTFGARYQYKRISNYAQPWGESRINSKFSFGTKPALSEAKETFEPAADFRKTGLINRGNALKAFESGKAHRYTGSQDLASSAPKLKDPDLLKILDWAEGKKKIASPAANRPPAKTLVKSK